MSKLAKFLVVGLPAFLIAVPLNYTLVELAGWPKPVAYALVLVVQVTMNFFACRWVVFNVVDHKPVQRQFIEFMAGILGFRIADWILYSILILLMPSLYIGIQVLNVILFAALKYRYSKKVFEGQ